MGLFSRKAAQMPTAEDVYFALLPERMETGYRAELRRAWDRQDRAATDEARNQAQRDADQTMTRMLRMSRRLSE
jgi:hypothetical protein